MHACSVSKWVRVDPEEHALIMELAAKLGAPAWIAVSRWPKCPRCGFILSVSPRGRNRVECRRCGAEYALLLET